MPPGDHSPPVTQRAYTFRLRGPDPSDQSWRDALWKTHEAVNKGAKVFGDWLLTLRGGLAHTLVEARVKKRKSKRKGKGNSKENGEDDREPTAEERKSRRILLALSWLSVESKLGAPEKFIVATGEEAAQERSRKVIGALKEILEKRGLTTSEIEQWENDCSASLSAAIRDDAVWVNRSKAFDEVVHRVGPSLTREELWDMLGLFFASPNAYLAPVTLSEEEPLGTEQEDKAKDLVKKAGQWLSSRFGTGKGADFSHIAGVYEKLAEWAHQAQAGMTGQQAIYNLIGALNEFNPSSNDLEGLLRLISGPGYKSATRNLLGQFNNKTAITQDDLKRLAETALADKVKCETNSSSKGERAYANSILHDVESACGFTYRVDKGEQPVPVSDYSHYANDYRWGPANHSEFAVMLDHAARRVSLAHTWIKRAEAERRQFEENAKKIDKVPKVAREWLDSLCAERSIVLGALEPYRIRRRAVDGWKHVVAAWSKSDCKTAQDRITAARLLQEDPEIDKFGDIQLFEALAEDHAVCVWQRDGEAGKTSDPQLLIDYALAAEAEFKKRHFKVPAYRHPEAFWHPVFCDFGQSRWKICFDVHKNRQSRRQRACANRISRKICFDVHKKRQTLRLSLEVWTGSKMLDMPLCWQCKRLARDLALGQDHKKDRSCQVTRADRLGRAVSNVARNQEVQILGLFEQEYWNGRLQAPRPQLEALGRYIEKHGWDAKAQKSCRAIRWMISFSPRLQPAGPWGKFAEKLQLNPNPKYWPHAEDNKDRGSRSKLILCRLPGLRVLSVDLGHRYAAACAVWEAVDAEQVKEACQAAGHREPNENDLYLHLKKRTTKQKKGSQGVVEETTIYRRIGADTLPDCTPHPAPWARLDRQFLIRLQGEEDEARAASNEEVWAVHKLEAELGRTIPLIDRLLGAGWGQTEKQKARLKALRELGWTPANKCQAFNSTDETELRRPSLAVDELMLDAVGTLRLALKRHGDRARIARYLITDERTKPGGVKEKLDENGRIELLQDALIIWHGLFSSPRWRDDAAKQLWNEHIAKLVGEQNLVEVSEDASGSERRTKQKQNREKLREAAKALVDDVALRQALHDMWKRRWEEEDREWRRRLRWFKDWVLPRREQARKAYSRPAETGSSSHPKRRARYAAIRRVGGLSLTRLATLTEFRRKVQVGFFTRLKPDGTKAEAKEGFGQSTLDALEHLRAQRVKQLASRIVEAALGVGRIRRFPGVKNPKRPDTPVDKPCHAIVIENLTHYRPEETRTRRENRQLMTWSSSKIKKYLAEACQLYGLHLREVTAAYTSRQDSRTGAPGLRCQDVPVKEFMRSLFWRKEVAQAEKKLTAGKGSSYERLLCELNQRWKDNSPGDGKRAELLRLPHKGGEIFVSAAPDSPAARGLQADLNAAANIGLRALTDPDWPGKWWHVPCNAVTFRPVEDKVKGSAAVKLDQSLRQVAHPQSKDPGAKKSKEIVNLWCDISSLPLEHREWKLDWEPYPAYWNNVQCRVIRVLQGKV